MTGGSGEASRILQLRTNADISIHQSRYVIHVTCSGESERMDICC